jgi:hypothetical protein
MRPRIAGDTLRLVVCAADHAHVALFVEQHASSRVQYPMRYMQIA